mmetsp:Transcript_7859/g.21847  ORF Transcript_7859/g.21847 Transcript_7859/m.21847 type:complete len:91 (+) Transcript_7859:127-399(+)
MRSARREQAEVTLGRCRGIQHEGRHDTKPTKEVETENEAFIDPELKNETVIEQKLQNETFIEQKSKTETGEDQREKAEAELGMTCQLSRL